MHFCEQICTNFNVVHAKIFASVCKILQAEDATQIVCSQPLRGIALLLMKHDAKEIMMNMLTP